MQGIAERSGIAWKVPGVILVQALKGLVVNGSRKSNLKIKSSGGLNQKESIQQEQHRTKK